MPRVKKPSIPAKILAQSITSTATSFKLNNILDWNGVALTSSAFGDYAWGTFRNATNTQVEYFRFDPSTIASASITIVKRGLDYLGADYDSEITLNKYSWSANETVVELGTNPPGFYDQFAAKYNAETIGAVWTFGSTTRPKLDSDVDSVDSAEFITLGQLNRTALGTTLTDRIAANATAGETVAAGNIVYYKVADGRWWKASAAATATCENVQLGVARGAGTAGNSITGGVLLRGVDTNRTGLTLGATQYLSDTAGVVSASVGTLTVSLGSAKSTTEMYFNPRFLEMPLGGQKAALAGTSGTPSASNKFITEADVVTTDTSSKVVRRASDGTITNKVSTAVSVTAGETIAAGDFLTFLQYSSTIPSDDSQLSEGNPATNYGSAPGITLGRGGAGAGDDNWVIVKWDISSLMSSVDKAEFAFNVDGDVSTAAAVTIVQVTSADWSEGTVTWANKPTGSNYLTSQTITKGWNVFDITTLYNNWKSGTNNYGILIQVDGTPSSTFYASEQPTATSRPQLILTKKSTKVFKVDPTSSYETSDIIGVAKTGGVLDSTITAIVDGVANGFTSLSQGGIYYLADAGTISTTQGTLETRVGKSLSTTEIQFGLGEHEYVGYVTALNLRILVPRGATRAVVTIAAAGSVAAEVYLTKGFKNTGSFAAMVATWDTTTDVISLTGTTPTSGYAYFYR